MAKEPKGVSEVRRFSCNRCNVSYSKEKEAKDCFDKGLPERLAVGTTYHRVVNGDEYFSICFLSGKPSPKKHQRTYVVGAFPESVGKGYEFLEARVSFDGECLDFIGGAHPRGGVIELGSLNATRVSTDQMEHLLEDPEFREFHRKVVTDFSR
jgi:hypothetical protein